MVSMQSMFYHLYTHWWIVLLCSSFALPTQGFPKPIHPIFRVNAKHNMKPNTTTWPHKMSKHNQSINRIQSFGTLIRASNIWPVTVMSFSGGLIMSPTLIDAIKCKTLYASTATTLLILSSSMIINDLFDIPLDKVNNPSRPLVSKAISIKEAVISLVLMTGLAEIINVRFLPPIIQPIVHLANIIVFLYTPFLKRIPLVKNLSCAIMIFGAIFTGGLSTSVNYHKFIDLSINAALLWVAGSSVFLGSVVNEVLLDMSDVDGDKAHGIWTIPVLFGKKVSWLFTSVVLIVNILSTSSELFYLLGKLATLPLVFVYVPMFYDMFEIQRAQFAKPAIMNAVKGSSIPLVTLLFYLVYLSKIV